MVAGSTGPDWGDVRVGDFVLLESKTAPEHCGEVDALTEQGDVIWVWDPIGGRRLFHVEDGLKLTVAGR
jgi:hypothetical protein